MSQTKIRSRRRVVWGWIVYGQRLVRLALKYLNNPFVPSIFRENLMTEQARGVSVKDHHGGHFLTQKQIEPSMSALKAQLTAEFNARVKALAQPARAFHGPCRKGSADNSGGQRIERPGRGGAPRFGDLEASSRQPSKAD
jgi:hypothetical protein